MLNDLRYAWRQLLKDPGFTGAAVLTLGLGIGANTAIFSVVNAVLLQSLPFRIPQELVYAWENELGRGIPESTVSYPDFLDWREQGKSFADLAAFAGGTFSLSSGGEPEQVLGMQVSANYFDVLGVQPVFGRTLVAEESKPGQGRVVVLSSATADRLFSRGREAIGKTISLNRRPYTVVGVMPAGFSAVNQRVALWVPGTPPLNDDTWRNQRFLQVIGRLKPGVALSQADVEIKAIAGRLAQAHKANEGVGAYLVPIADQITGQSRRALFVLLGTVGLVLLIACANLANLLLVRGAARRREIAVRGALGATRSRLVRQLLTESLVLSWLGGALGLLLAHWGMEAIRSLAADRLPRIQTATIDSTVLLFTAGLALLTGLGFGIMPAFHVCRGGLKETLSEGSRAVVGRGGRLRDVLVILEMAAALMLLVGAGLLMHSFLRLRAFDTGFNPANVLTFELSLPGSLYPEDRHRAAFFQELLERLRVLPGVKAAGGTLTLPLGGGGRYWTMLEIAGRPVPSSREAIPVVSFHQITPGYLEAMSVRLLKGRVLGPQDSVEAPKTVLISQTLARRYFANEEPLGRQIRLGTETDNPWLTIVGVVADIALDRLTESKPPVVYSAHAQGLQGAAGSMVLAVRTATDPMTLLPAIRKEVQAMDKELPLAAVAPLERVADDARGAARLQTLLLGLFAALALLLAGVGIYGVLSYSVAQRTGEIGVRMAVGATVTDIFRLVLGHGSRLAVIGLAVGLVGALAMARTLGTLLFEVKPFDPTTYCLVSLVLLTVAALATVLPARRAAKLDPMDALRCE